MGLLDGGLAASFAAVFGPMYLDATLHRRIPLTYDDGGTVIGGDFTDEDVKAQFDSATEAMRQSPGYTDKDQRIFVLASGLAEIKSDDEITVSGQRWAIASVSRDPVGAYFELRGQRA